MKNFGLLFIAFISLLLLDSCKKKTTTEIPTPVNPEVTPLDNGNGKYSFDFNGIHFEADSNKAGKVVSLTLNGTEFLIPTSVNATNFGNSLWPSPQSMWNWPPPAALDVNTYSGSIIGNTIVLTSKKDAGTGLVFKKEYSANSAKNYITLKYSITNLSGASKNLAAWEITRVYPGGLTLYPSGNTTKTGTLATLTKDSIGHTWFQYDANTIPSGVPKLISDGNGGWMAQLNNNILLVKTFPNVPDTQMAPSEGEIELYANPDKTYIEVEQQSSYGPLANNDTLVWEVRWYLSAVPAGTNTTVGSQALVEYINGLVQ